MLHCIRFFSWLAVCWVTQAASAQNIVVSSTKPTGDYAIDELGLEGDPKSTPIRRIDDVGNARVLGHTIKESTGFDLESFILVSASNISFGTTTDIRLAILEDTNNSDRGDTVVYNELFDLNGLSFSDGDYVEFLLGSDLAIKANTTYEIQFAYSDPGSTHTNFLFRRSENGLNNYPTGTLLDENSFHFNNRGFPVTDGSLALSGLDRDLFFGLTKPSADPDPDPDPTPIPTDRPNIILIFTDDLGWGDISLHGNTSISTPQIDRLATEGVRFTNGYVTHAYCGPSRAGIMAGRYQQRFGFEANPAKTDDDMLLGIAPSEILMPQALQSAGYRTACIGKWHLGATPIHHPLNRGFDEFYGFLDGDANYWDVEQGGRIHNISREYDWVNDVGYLTDNFTDATLDFIDRNRHDRFFVYLSLNAVHGPFQATSYYQSLVNDPNLDNLRKVQLAMVLSVEETVKRIRQKLADLNLTEDTLIVFTNDNGGHTGDNGMNLPLRGHKGTHFEGGLRVPFFMIWPGKIPAGTVVDDPVITLDLYATFANAAGVQPEDRNPNLDGVDLLPYILGHETGPPHDALYWRDGTGWQFTVRQGNYKLKGGADSNRFPPSIFDVVNDPYETTNLYNSRPDLAASLRSTYNQWNATLPRQDFGNNQTFPNPISGGINSPATATANASGNPATISFTTNYVDSSGGSLNYIWQVEGEGKSFIHTPTGASSVIEFNNSGSYEVRVTVNNGRFLKEDLVTVNVSGAPSVPVSDIPTLGQTVWIESIASGKRLLVNNDGGEQVLADADPIYGSDLKPGIGSQWGVLRAPNGYLSLVSIKTGKLMKVGPAPDFVIAATEEPSETPTDSAQFQFQSEPNSRFSIVPKVAPSSRVSVDTGVARNPASATGTAGNSNTQFTFGALKHDVPYTIEVSSLEGQSSATAVQEGWFTVFLQPSLTPEINVVWVEERFPADWTVEVRSMSHGGTFDAQNKVISWGPFFGTFPNLSYELRLDSSNVGGFNFSGDLAVNSMAYPSTGTRHLAPKQTESLTDWLSRIAPGSLASDLLPNSTITYEMAYALGIEDPSEFAAKAPDIFNLQSDNAMPELVFKFTRSKTDASNFALEHSSNLSTWDPVPFSEIDLVAEDAISWCYQTTIDPAQGPSFYRIFVD
ncbi:MAG: sulfatase-like hydrolase/transferase [Verrucomicrobiota bacterium]